MHEGNSEQYVFDTTGEETESPSRLALWVWPVIGSLAIAAIVVTVLQSPSILTKFGLPAKAPASLATPTIPSSPAEPVKIAENSAPQAVKPAVNDIAALQIDISRMADTLKAINTSIVKQNARIGKLERIVGTVTGAISRPAGKDASSARPKTVNIKPESQINTAQKADMLTSTALAKARIGPLKSAISPTTTHRDTVKTRAKPSTTKLAALKTTRKSRIAVQKEQYAVKLARARTVSRLAVEWERLIRGNASELSVLEPQVMPTVTKKGNKVFDLVAGPFNHIADAIELCARLKLEGIKCKQAIYGGKPL